MADFRYDEGIRIRDNFISPTLKASLKKNDIANSILLIEVYENKECYQKGIYRSE